MSIQPATPPETKASNGNRYGNAFLSSDAPDHRLPAVGMPADDAMRLLGEELVLDGIPMRNLATFVTTWMEPQAQEVIATNLHRNYIDHAEYPQTADGLVEETLDALAAHLAAHVDIDKLLTLAR